MTQPQLQESELAVYWRCELGHRFAVDPEVETCPERDYDGSWCGAPIAILDEASDVAREAPGG